MTKQRLAGFTLLELVIAIIVFSMGVLAVMQVVIQNMRTVRDVTTLSEMTTLAKEGLELTFSLRDTNNLRGNKRNTTNLNNSSSGPSPFTKDSQMIIHPEINTDGLVGYVIATDPYITDASVLLAPDPNNDSQKYVEINNSARLFQNTTNDITMYSHDAGGEATPYYRVILFSQPVNIAGNNNTDANAPDANKLLTISSFIINAKGFTTSEDINTKTIRLTGSNHVLLQSFIGNY